MNSRIVLCASLWTFLILDASVHAQGSASEYQKAESLGRRFSGKVYRDKVDPHWFAGGDRFWYRNQLPGGQREYVLVDALRGRRELAFDHAILAEALRQSSGKSISKDQLPVDQIDQRDGSLVVSALGKTWKFDSSARRWIEDPQPLTPVKPGTPPPSTSSRGRGSAGRGSDSPDGKWSLLIREQRLILKEKRTGTETELARGSEADAFNGEFYWSPDSAHVIALRVRPGKSSTLTLVESLPEGKILPKAVTMPYAKPGDPIDQARPCLFSALTRKEIAIPDDLFKQPWTLTRFHWSPDSQRFYFLYNQRGHQVMRLIAIEPAKAQARAIIDEASRTFVDYPNKTFLEYLDDRAEVLWMSERDGWNHLYLMDAITGAVKKQLTQGPWLVRQVERWDPETRTLELRILGIDATQDPYHVHFARVQIPHGQMTRLTEGDGTHAIVYSPDRRFYIDTWSRIDLPPVTELRRTSDGTRVCDLEKADVSELRAAGWSPPERFVAKGRDGKTDIWGVIWKPTNFQAAKKYPVIEEIYAGPQSHFVPKRFSAVHGQQSLAELGFIVVKCDGMGTNWRSKAFHDVCWKNLGDSGFPDRIAWIKSAAKDRPHIDLSRGVGIYGGSAGGQSALRALLAHGDFYKVAVADCGCHDNRVDKIWWNELWMSWPIGPHYAEQSNVTQAHKLTGKLLLVVGEMDRNVDPACTYQVVHALIKADKDFDLLVIPSAGHGAAESPYGQRRRMDFFVRHLLNVEPRHSNRVK